MRFIQHAGLCLATAAVMAAGPLHAQADGLLHLDASAGMGIPRGGFGSFTEAAPSYSVEAGLRVLPQLTLFGRYGTTRFEWTEPDGRSLDADEGGFSAGASTTLGSQLSPGFPLSPWVGVAALFHRLEIPELGEIDERAGVELMAGVELAPLPAVRIRPSLAYRHYRIRGDVNPGAEDGAYYLPLAVEYFRPAVDVAIVF